MRVFLLILFFLLLLILPATLLAQPTEGQPWFDDFKPQQQFWISPGGMGDGSLENPMSFTMAINQAQPGDLYWFLPGIYAGGRDLIMERGGTAEAPVVYRACPETRVTLDGGIGFLSAHTWLWGMEITNLSEPAEGLSWINTPDGPIKGGSALVNVKVPGGRLINNIVHDSASSQSGIGGWDGGAGQIFYGNISTDNGHDPDTEQAPHGLYAQNNYENDGYKYFVNNIFLDHSSICGEKCYNFNAHSQGVGFVSGFYLFQNVFANGRVAVGGANAHASPSDNHIITGNFFYETGKVQLGFRKPWQGIFSENYLAGNSGLLLTIWGADEETFPKPGGSIIRQNTFVENDSLHYLDLYAMTSSSSIGGAGLSSDDLIDENYYGEGFKSKYWVDENPLTIRTLADWQNQSAIDSDGDGFDLNSVVGPNPAENAVFLLPNSYEPGRGHLVIFNWAGLTAAKVDLSDLLDVNQQFVIKDAQDYFGEPILTGTYKGQALEVPTPGEFEIFVVQPIEPNAPSPCQPPIEENNTNSRILLLSGLLAVTMVSIFGFWRYRTLT